MRKPQQQTPFLMLLSMMQKSAAVLHVGSGKRDSLANSEDLSKETQLGSRDRSPAVAFSNCC